MHKLTPLAAGVCLLLTGCHAPRHSRTWEIVRSTRHPGPGKAKPSAAYAGELHHALQKSGVEHKVVTFKFRYSSRLTLNATGEETAVIYRDDATPAQPWWIMAEQLWRPMWLPTQPVAAQVSLFVRRPATVVKVEDFPAQKAARDGKTLLKPFRTGK